MSRINSFSKWITVAWIVAWLETLLFSQAATAFGFGDAMAINYINENVKDIGKIIAGFYFGKSVIENCFQGYEEHREKMLGMYENYEDQADEL